MVYRQILLYPVFKNQVGERVKGKKSFELGLGCWMFLKFVSFENFQGRIRKVHTEAETGIDAATNQGMPTSPKAERGKKQMLPRCPWRDMAVLKPCFGCSAVLWTFVHHRYERIHLSCLKPPRLCSFVIAAVGNIQGVKGSISSRFLSQGEETFLWKPTVRFPSGPVNWVPASRMLK